MRLAFSTGWFGNRAFDGLAVLDALRVLDVRSAVFAASSGGRPAPSELLAVLRPAGARVVAVEAALRTRRDEAESLPPASLVSASSHERARACAALVTAATDARAAGAPFVLVRLGSIELDGGARRVAQLRGGMRTEGVSDAVRKAAASLLAEVDARADAALERACRGLFEVCRAAPDVRFAIVTPDSPLAFPTHRALGLLLDETRGKNVGYWHDSGAAWFHERLGVTPSLAWCGDHAERTLGASLHDVAGAEDHVPPGAGEIDFRALAEILPGGVPCAIDVDARYPLRELQHAASLLRSLGE